jgi:hypothetical protein
MEQGTVAFGEHTNDAVGRVRRAFGDVVDALPRAVTRASELQHVLNIDKVLAWRIFNVMRCADPFVAARYIPGSSGSRIFLRAARKRGVPAGVTEMATAALSDYQKLQRVHAGNRKRFDMLLAAHTDEGRAEVEVAQRRQAYEANSYIWGASASVQFRTMFTGFSGTSGELDFAGLRGLIALQRLRPEVRWPLGKAMCTKDDGGDIPSLEIEPLYDVEHPDEAAARLFMSHPRPRLECKRAGDVLRWELLPGRVGRTGAVSCVTGEIKRRCCPICQTVDNPCATYVVRVQTPSELLIVDHFVHRELFGAVEHELVMYGGCVDGPREDIEQVPIRERMLFLGKASDLLHTPEIPRYADMTEHMFDRLGWEAAQFDVYRLRLEYPIMLSEVRLSHPLRD